MRITTNSTNLVEAHFDTILLNVNYIVEASPMTASIKLPPIQFQPTKYVNRPTPPTCPPGTFVVLQSDGECVQAGLVSHVNDDADSPEFVISVWPLTEPVGTFSPKGGRTGNLSWGPKTYVFEGTVWEETFCGQLWQLTPAEGGRLRQQIFNGVPTNLLEVFWSPEARQALEVCKAETQRYENAVLRLIESL